MVDAIVGDFRKTELEFVDRYLNEPTPIMWDLLLEAFGTALEKAELTCLAKAQRLDCNETDTTGLLSDIGERTWVALRSKIDNHMSNDAIRLKLRKHFESCFLNGAHGNRRKLYQARAETAKLIELYSRIAPLDSSVIRILPGCADPAFEDSLVLLRPQRMRDLTVLFESDIDELLVNVDVEPSKIIQSVASTLLQKWGGSKGIGNYFTSKEGTHYGSLD